MFLIAAYLILDYLAKSKEKSSLGSGIPGGFRRGKNDL